MKSRRLWFDGQGDRVEETEAYGILLGLVEGNQKAVEEMEG
jgi:hypothetical protein